MHHRGAGNKAGVFSIWSSFSHRFAFWDTQCGFKAFRMSVCRPLSKQRLSIGFGFDVDWLYLAFRAD